MSDDRICLDCGTPAALEAYNSRCVRGARHRFGSLAARRRLLLLDMADALKHQADLLEAEGVSRETSDEVRAAALRAAEKLEAKPG